MNPRARNALVAASIIAALAPAASVGVAGAAGGERLSLDAAWERTLARSPDLRAARTRLTKARAAREAALAALMPSLGLSARYTLNDAAANLGDSAVVLQHDLRGSLSFGATLFDAAAWLGRDVAARSEAAERAAVAELEQERLLEVARAFHSAVLARRLGAVVDTELEMRRKYLAASEARRAGGDAVALDVARARAAVHGAERRQIEAEQVAAEALDTLALAIGEEPAQPWELIEPALPGASETDAAASAGVEGRASIRAAEARMAAAGEAEDVAWAALAPTVGVTGVISVGEPNYVDPDGFSSAVMVELRWTLFDGGARYARMDEAAADLAAARARVEEARLDARALARRAARAITLTGRRLAAATAERQAAGEAYQAALRGFELGKGTGLDVLAAEEAAVSAEAARVREETALHLSHLVLRRARGDVRGGAGAVKANAGR